MTHTWTLPRRRPSPQTGCQRIYQGKASGARAVTARPELARLLDQLREGDTVVVWKLDRLARSTRDLLEIMATVGKRLQKRRPAATGAR